MASSVPTKSNLMAAQKSLRLAKLGHELLDKKKNILISELLKYSDGAKDIKQKCAAAYKQAYASLKRANLTMGRCGEYADRVPIDNTFEFTKETFMGMSLPTVLAEPSESFPYFGLIETDSYIDEAFAEFNKAKMLTAELCSVQASICRLSDAIKKTQKRANALGNVQIPMLTEKIKFMSEALDEKEREDFSRLKMIKKQ